MTESQAARVGVIGAGQMGLVCCAILTDPDRAAPPLQQAMLWSHSREEAGTLTQTRHSDRLEGFELSQHVRVAVSDADAFDHADLIVSAIPVQHLRATWTRLKAHLPQGVGIVSVSKGVENGTLLRPTQVIADVLADDPDAAPRPFATLSGPTIAAELARCLPATMVAASDQPQFADLLQRAFTTRWLRIYTNPDVLGVELAGATKNVIAIAAGILDGLSAGFNAKSALLARGLAEIARLGTSMGASKDTFSGVAGVGDLATTCFSPEGRNRSLGEALGRGERLDEYLEQSRHVVEGVATTRSVMDLAQRYRVEMPITEAVHDVLFENLDPLKAIGRLMTREPKSEDAA